MLAELAPVGLVPWFAPDQPDSESQEQRDATLFTEPERTAPRAKMPDTQVGPRLVGDVESTTYIVNQDVDSVKGMLHRVDNGSRPCFCRQIAEGLAALLPLASMWSPIARVRVSSLP